jgi:two-component system chemotaxis response regulator CheB
MKSCIRVLIVDDSAFARKVLRELLQSSPEFEVVGVARDGLEALEKISELRPDVVTLDLVMPNLGGADVIQNLPTDHPPRVVVVSSSSASSELAVAALQNGAFDLVHKPTALATDQLYELGAELLRKVRAAGLASKSPRAPAAIEKLDLAVPKQTSHKVLVVGTSTGGPQALTRLLTTLPADFPVPIVVALHIPAGYTSAMAARLNAAAPLEIQEAAEGMLLRPGLAILARGGAHLQLISHKLGVAVTLEASSNQKLYCPSIDLLFQSAVDCYGAGVLGAVLTGMGDDGRLGAGAIQAAGGLVLTEAESSCVIYGMPRCVVEHGHSAGSFSLDDMARALIERL